MALPLPDDFTSLEQTATTLNKPYFIYASVAGERHADSLYEAVGKNPTLYSFIRIHYLSSFVGPVALQNGFASFRQLYRITENTLLVFDPAGRVLGRHTGIESTAALYRILYEAKQQVEASPNPIGALPPVTSNQRRITSPVPHPLEAEVATTATPTAADIPQIIHAGAGPAINRYTVVNPCLPGLKAYKPETDDARPASVVMGLYPTQPRLVSALQALRAQTSLPCYTFLASDLQGNPFYVLSVGAFANPILAWEQVSIAIPGATPVCVGLLAQP